MAAFARTGSQASNGPSLVHFIVQNNAAASHRAGEGSIRQGTTDLNLRAEFLMGSGSERGGLCNFIQKSNKQSIGQQRASGPGLEEIGMRGLEAEDLSVAEQGDEWMDVEEGGEDVEGLSPKSCRGWSEVGSDPESPPRSHWNLWDFVKGLTPPNSPLRTLGILGSWKTRLKEGEPRALHGQEDTESTMGRSILPAAHNESTGSKMRSTLPVRMKLRGRPNINKVIKKLNEKGKLCSEAKRTLERDFNANSSRASTTSRRSTIAKLMNKIVGNSRWLPLTCENLKNIAAVFKEEGYKSAELYLNDLKLMHIEKGHHWSAQLDRVFKQCKLSVNRGRGPKKKAKEVPEDIWAQGGREAEEEGESKVWMARRLFAMEVQWMMREIEIAALTVDNLSFNRSLKTVTLTWFECKTDQEGFQITRVLQCQCEGSSCGLRCPYDNAMQLVKSAHEVDQGEPRSLAVTKGNKPASKHLVLKAWRALFGKDISGHSTRRSGALQYIRRGWSISQVAFLGRWKSNIILQYADEALQSIPVNASQNFNLEKKDLAVVQQTGIPADVVIQQEIVLELKEEIRRLKSGSISVEERLKEFQEKKDNNNKIDPSLLPNKVSSLKSGVVHQNVTLLLCTPPHTWRTLCGWHYNSSAYTFTEENEVTCQKCLNIAQGKEEERR